MTEHCTICCTCLPDCDPLFYYSLTCTYFVCSLQSQIGQARYFECSMTELDFTSRPAMGCRNKRLRLEVSTGISTGMSISMSKHNWQENAHSIVTGLQLISHGSLSAALYRFCLLKAALLDRLSLAFLNLNCGMSA